MTIDTAKERAVLNDFNLLMDMADRKPAFTLSGAMPEIVTITHRFSAALDEIDRLREALREIANLDVPRPIGTVYRRDGVASKNDRCHHDVWVYEECADCVADFARAALTDTPQKEE